MTDGRTDGQTDGQTDGRTDGRTDGGDCNIPNAFLKKRGDKYRQIIIGNVASSYQVNLAIEIPNLTENYINSHVFACRHWVSALLIQI